MEAVLYMFLLPFKIILLNMLKNNSNLWQIYEDKTGRTVSVTNDSQMIRPLGLAPPELRDDLPPPSFFEDDSPPIIFLFKFIL